jgi:hypothetical protein
MTSERHAPTRALHAAVNGRDPEMREALRPPGAIAALGALHWCCRLEVVE